MRSLIFFMVFLGGLASFCLIKGDAIQDREREQESSVDLFCWPQVTVSQEQKLWSLDYCRQEVIRRLQQAHQVVETAVESPDHLWRALVAVAETEALLGLHFSLESGPLKVRQIDLKSELMDLQWQKIRAHQLEIARYQHLGDLERVRYFQRRLLKYVPDRYHPLHQKLKIDLQEW